MSYKIVPTQKFLKELKSLHKKYPSVINDVDVLFEWLKENPFYGDALGDDSYKIRLAITSKGKGKSGGARLITHLIIRDKEVFLLSIYDKSEQASISKNEIKQRIKALKK